MINANKAKKSKKKVLLAKLSQAMKAIEQLDAKLASSDDKAEKYAREQAGLIGEILIENLVKVKKDDDGKITHLTFKKHIEEPAEKCRLEYSKKGKKGLLPTNWAIRSLLPLEPSVEYPQVYWNRKTRYGYSILAALYNHPKWKGADYREHVEEHGYSTLAKDGRKAHNGDSDEQDFDDEKEDDQPKGKSADKGVEDRKADKSDNDAGSIVTLDFKAVRKLKPKLIWDTCNDLPKQYDDKIVIARIHDDNVAILKVLPSKGTLTYPKEQK